MGNQHQNNSNNQKPPHFWKMAISPRNSSAAEILLYGPISESTWWGDEITPQQFADDLAALGPVSEITVRINSGGGDVFAGMSINAMLKRHAATVTVYIDGLAASIASIIAMAGDKVVMPRGSMMMVHNPWSSLWGGDANDFRTAADVLDKIRDSMIEVYAARTGLTSEELKSIMDAETWMTATEAVEKGFADEVEDAIPVSASARGRMAFFNGVEHDLTRFMNAPNLPEHVPPPAPTPAPVPKNEGVKPMSLTLEELKNKYPDVYSAAVSEGATTERARMKAIDELAMPGNEEILAKAKYETGISAAETAVALIKADKERQAQYQNALVNDAQASGVNDLTPAAAPVTHGAGAQAQQIQQVGADIAKIAAGLRRGR
ncbi:head maturation protease, ClpP-related [Tumebacillus flagellatus]|uniref:ATP-dependent Clp protease proteolytic subunit n=1 Tax=Tumebacillus flagellatus TaxID=1157490 RepID=A0A074LUZ4_9BACL|nr:head maturation protease, ClpP-related [Tumebacillus flagellatus]KEO84764.1 hypothetical protein EL26_01775 [Tumebacillus flagellatus]